MLGAKPVVIEPPGFLFRGREDSKSRWSKRIRLDPSVVNHRQSE
jgi:hypothetical protein